MSALAELRKTLEERYGATLPVAYRSAQGVGTGLAALDALLPGGGLGRGRLTCWRPGGGATALLRSVCGAAAGRGERAAWVDAARTQTADYWDARTLLVRAEGAWQALTCAELLLRSGGFAVVVVSGGGREWTAEGVRLTRAAREGGSALVVVTGAPVVSQLRVETRLDPARYRWRRGPFGEPVEVEGVCVEVAARSLGWSGATTLWLPVLERPRRWAPERGLPDRRGVSWRRGGGWGAKILAGDGGAGIG
jgi:hypothetical protein